MTYTQSPWSLTDLFPAYDSPEMKAGFDELDVKVVEFEALRPSLSADITEEAFLDLVARLEAISRLESRIYDFAALSFEANTQDQAIQAFKASVENRISLIENRLLFFRILNLFGVFKDIK